MTVAWSQPEYRAGLGDSPVTFEPERARRPIMAELLVAMIGALLAGLRPRASLVARTSRCANSSRS